MRMYEPWFDDFEKKINDESQVNITIEEKPNYDNAAHFLRHRHSRYKPLVRVVNLLYRELEWLHRDFKSEKRRRNHDKQMRKNLRRLLIDLYCKHAEDPTRYTILSRNKSFYTARKWKNKYGEITVTRDIITCADALEIHGYAEIVRGQYREHFKRRSRIRMTEKLENLLANAGGTPKELYFSVEDECQSLSS